MECMARAGEAVSWNVRHALGRLYLGMYGTRWGGCILECTARVGEAVSWNVWHALRRLYLGMCGMQETNGTGEAVSMNG